MRGACQLTDATIPWKPTPAPTSQVAWPPSV